MERDGEVRDEAQLGPEVAVEAGVEGRGPLGAGESGQRLGEAAVLGQQQVVMVVLQMKRVEREAHP